MLLFFDVSGTNIGIGESIGEHFKERIRDYVEYRFQQISRECSELGVDFIRSEYYDISGQLIGYAKQHATEELQELLGISRATNLTLDDILFAVGYTDVFDLILSRKGKLSSALFETNAECTTFIYNKDGVLLCGQNWDMDEESANNICYFRKSYSDGSCIQGLSTIIGMVHIGINGSGLFVGTANLSSLHNSTSGLVFPITIQHLLRKPLNEESLKWLKTVSKAGGHYFYIVDNRMSAFAVECDGIDCIIRKVSGGYAHSNHYRESAFYKSGVIYSSDTIIRCQYIEKELCRQAIGVDAIKIILSNHANKICRHANNSYSQTCASVIFDASNSQIHLCEANPCTGIWHIKQINTKY